MERAILRQIAIASALVTASWIHAVPAAKAAPITIPGHTTFGTLAGATFGGTGIPNSAVAITTISDVDNTITLGMTAHARYSNPVVTSNGNGDFYATVGLNDGLVGSPDQGATWNFATYIDISGGGVLRDYAFELLYDFDPAPANDEATHGIINISSFLQAFGQLGNTRAEGSQNLAFGFLAIDNLPFVDAPGVAFNPFATGKYTFSLRVSADQAQLGETNIRVNVDTVPEPSTLAMIGLALLSLIGLGRLRRSPV